MLPYNGSYDSHFKELILNFKLVFLLQQQHTKAETGELPQELQTPISDLEKLSSSIIDAISGLKKLES